MLIYYAHKFKTNLLPETLYVGAAFANDRASILGQKKNRSKENSKIQNALPTELRVRTRSDSSPIRGRGILLGGGFPKDASPQSPRSRFLPTIISAKKSPHYRTIYQIVLLHEACRREVLHSLHPSC